MSPNVKACALSALAFTLLFCGMAWADEIDLVWSTFLGGSGYDYGYAIVVDDFGNAYVTGVTFSEDFPTTAGVFDETHNGGVDVFVAQFNSTGYLLGYATFLGGSDLDEGSGIAVDGSGDVYATGVYLWYRLSHHSRGPGYHTQRRFLRCLCD